MLKSRRAVQTVIGEICFFFFFFFFFCFFFFFFFFFFFWVPSKCDVDRDERNYSKREDETCGFDCAWKKDLMCWNACVTTVAGGWQWLGITGGVGHLVVFRAANGWILMNLNQRGNLVSYVRNPPHTRQSGQCIAAERTRRYQPMDTAEKKHNIT